MKNEALGYLSAGYSIFPVARNKRPIVPWKEFQRRRPSRNDVEEWWDEHPNALIGLVTGRINNLTVIDCDSTSASNIVEKRIPDNLDVPVASTPRTGRHYYFKHDKELPSINRVCAGLDVKSEGGYVIVPPSSGENGSYAWNNGFDIRDVSDVPEIPLGLKKSLLIRIRRSSGSVSRLAPSRIDENSAGNQVNSQEYQRLVQEYGEPFYLNKNGEVSTLNQGFWAGLHQAENIQLYEPDEQVFYRYNPDNGLYTIVSEDIIKREISERILDVSRQLGLASLEKKRTNSTLNQIVALLRGISETRDVFRRDNKFVHLANGVLVYRDNGQAGISPFSPDFYSRNRCPIPYVVSAPCRRFLEELLYPAVTPEDAVIIQKYAGLCLLGKNIIQKLLILTGKAGQSKTTLALILQNLVGQINVTELRTSHLSDRFEQFRYLKKNLLVGVDVPGEFLSARGAHVIKGLVGGDWFDAEQKGGTGSFPIQGNFCILITSNSRLRVRLDGDTDAWRRRLLIVHFEGEAPARKIPEFHKVLIREEGSGILNWALKGLGMLFRDIEEQGDIQLAEAQKTSVDRLLAESDSLRFFLVDRVEKDNSSDLSNTELVEAYAEYCPTKGWTAKPITIIHRELESLMLELFQTSKAHSLSRNEKSAKGYRGVRFKR